MTSVPAGTDRTDECIADLDWSATREDAAKLYAAAIRYDWLVDWTRFNAAIIERWSEAGLRYVKQRAWKLNRALAAVSSSPATTETSET